MSIEHLNRLPMDNFLGRQTAEWLNELAGQANQRYPSSPNMTVSQTPNGTIVDNDTPVVIPVAIPCVIVAAGPSDETDYTDCRYWVRQVLLVQLANAAFTDVAKIYLDPSPWAFYGTAINLAEAGANNSGGIHTLKTTDINAAVLDAQGRLTNNPTIVWVSQVDGNKPVDYANDRANTLNVFTMLPASGTYKITSVAGSFPQWEYTAKLVIGYDTTLAGPDRYVTNDAVVTLYNRCEWQPTGYPYTHGTGVTVADSTGAVATTFGGSEPGTCTIRSIGVGSTVDVTAYQDENDNVVRTFYAPNSAQ